MASVARGRLKAYIEWGSLAGGTLAIARDDADLTAGWVAADDADLSGGWIVAGDWEATFTGPYDDVSARVRSATLEAGRDDLLATMQAGRASLTLRDAAGIFNYANAASPLYGLIEDRMHPVKLVLSRAGVDRTRFYGLTRRVTWRPTGRKGLAIVECVDLFYWLERTNPVIASTGPTTTGAAIGLILDSARWLDPAARVLDVGDSIDDFSADGSRTALQLIGDLLEAERGVFYIAGDGRAIYEDRHARLLRTSQVTIADRMTHLEPEVDFDLVRNRVRVKRTQNDYLAEATDDDSIVRIGYSDLSTIETPYLQSDDQAEDLADWILPLVSDPTAPVRDLEIDGRENDLLDAILDLELVDRLTATESSGNTAGDFHVERYELNVAPGGRISASYLVSRASSYSPLLIAANDADVSSGSVATDDADIAAGTIVY